MTFDYDLRDYPQTGECELCEQVGNIHYIDDVWQCDHCLREERPENPEPFDFDKAMALLQGQEAAA